MPSTIADVAVLAQTVGKYQDDNYVVVVVGFCALFLFLQTFAIPGTLLLAILSGALFPWMLALVLVTGV